MASMNDDKRREQTGQEKCEQEGKRLKRLGGTYVQTTGFSNRKMRRQLTYGGMYLDEQEGCYRQNG